MSKITKKNKKNILKKLKNIYLIKKFTKKNIIKKIKIKNMSYIFT